MSDLEKYIRKYLFKNKTLWIKKQKPLDVRGQIIAWISFSLAKRLKKFAELGKIHATISPNLIDYIHVIFFKEYTHVMISINWLLLFSFFLSLFFFF